METAEARSRFALPIRMAMEVVFWVIIRIKLCVAGLRSGVLEVDFR